jgi:hypothetical protein
MFFDLCKLFGELEPYFIEQPDIAEGSVLQKKIKQRE